MPMSRNATIALLNTLTASPAIIRTREKADFPVVPSRHSDAGRHPRLLPRANKDRGWRDFAPCALNWLPSARYFLCSMTELGPRSPGTLLVSAPQVVGGRAMTHGLKPVLSCLI